MEKSRRKNGEGSIFQVSENKWVAKISVGTRPDGKSNIKQFSGKIEAIVLNFIVYLSFVLVSEI